MKFAYERLVLRDEFCPLDKNYIKLDGWAGFDALRAKYNYVLVNNPKYVEIHFDDLAVMLNGLYGNIDLRLMGVVAGAELRFWPDKTEIVAIVKNPLQEVRYSRLFPTEYV